MTLAHFQIPRAFLIVFAACHQGPEPVILAVLSGEFSEYHHSILDNQISTSIQLSLFFDKPST
jgi:hypothetical protein